MYRNFKNLSDNELALELQGNYDPLLFNELFGRYKNKILQQCRLLVQNTDTAEDLTQEILIKIFMKINSFKAESHFSTWVYSIAHHTCIDYIRKNKRNLYQLLSEEIAEAFEDEQESDELLDFSFEKFDKMLEEMEPEARTVIILKYKQNLSIKEMQDHLKIGESAIKMRLLRAREKMRKYFK